MVLTFENMLWTDAECSRQGKIVSSIVSNGSNNESPPFLRSKSPNRPVLAQINESPFECPSLVPVPESSVLGASSQDFDDLLCCHEPIAAFKGYTWGLNP